MKITDYNETVKSLAEWIEGLKEAAKDDSSFSSIFWFTGTEQEPFSIIGGWLEGFSENYADLMCISKSNPKYAMCIKIATNKGPYAYTDFAVTSMPVDSEGIVDDTCVALEWEDNSEELAAWLLTEWERITKEHTV